MPPLHDDEIGRVRVLAYAVETFAPAYRAVMRIFATAKARFRIQLRAADVVREIEQSSWGGELPESGIDGALDQLVEWGNLERSHDTERVATLADFHRRRYVYRITPAGEAAEAAIGAVLAALRDSGSLQQVMLGAIARNLARLAELAGEPAPDPVATFQAAFDVTRQFESLAQNASTFMTRLHDVIEHSSVDADSFVVYKHEVVAYLQDFLTELSRATPGIVRAIEQLGDAGLVRIGEIAATADQAPTLEVERDVAGEITGRLRGIRAWFVGVGGEAATVELLRGAARGAINRILLVLQRLHDNRFKKVDRTADLLQLAGWLASGGDGAVAHNLFQTAFGMWSARHLSEQLADPEAVEPSTSWAEAPAAELSVALRERATRTSPGRSGRVADTAAARRQMAEAHRLAATARARALRRFLGAGPMRMSALGVLENDELDALLGLLDRLLTVRADSRGSRRAHSRDGRLRLELAPPSGRTRVVVRSRRGQLTLPDWELHVEAVARRARGVA